MELELLKGRPADRRIDMEEHCYALLDSLGIEYYRVDHEHADTIEACHGIESVLGCGICKNLFLCNRQATEFYLLLLPGDKPFKTKLLSKQIGSARLSFASADYMEELLDITPGSVSVLGLMNDAQRRVHLLIDNDLLADEYLGCHPCINTSTLRIAMSDVLQKLIPAMGHVPAFVTLPWNPEEYHTAVPVNERFTGTAFCYVPLLFPHVHTRDALGHRTEKLIRYRPGGVGELIDAVALAEQLHLAADVDLRKLRQVDHAHVHAYAAALRRKAVSGGEAAFI